MIPNEAEFLGALRKVIAAFDALGIEYALGGSLASSVYGEARATRDADIVAAVAGKHAAGLSATLRSEFYVDEPQIVAAATNQGSFNLIHLTTMSKIDVYVVWRTDFGRTQLARRRRKQVGLSTPLDLYVASPEDTVLAKLQCYRDGGGVSDRQWRDVLGVLKVQARVLDRAYLRKWAERLGLTDLLHRAFDDAGLAPDQS
jgi:hypothetical protein